MSKGIPRGSPAAPLDLLPLRGALEVLGLLGSPESPALGILEALLMGAPPVPRDSF